MAGQGGLVAALAAVLVLAASCAGGDDGGDAVTVTAAAATRPAAEQAAEEWRGTYAGTVTWDCGSSGTRRGTLGADFTIEVAPDGTATLQAPHTVSGSCAGPNAGSRTTPITVTGRKTPSGFEFPSTTWGPPGELTIAVAGEHGAGRLTGPAPGKATIRLDFAVDCVTC
jgi:hypothetical protein